MAKPNHKRRQENNLMKISCINLRIATELIEAGFVTIRHLHTASDNDLLAIPGINAEKLAEIRAYCAGQ